MANFPKPSVGGGGVDIDTGDYLARSCAVAFIGTQENTYQETGKVNHRPELLISFELPDVQLPDGRPATVTWRNHFTVNEKSNYYKLLKGWSGKALSIDAAAGLDPTVLINKPALVTIGHTKAGKPKVDGVRPAKDVRTKEKIPVPPLVNEQCVYVITEHDEAQFQLLWDWVKELCMKAPEWHGHSHDSTDDNYSQEEPASEPNPDVDDLPFGEDDAGEKFDPVTDASSIAGVVRGSDLQKSAGSGFVGKMQEDDEEDIPF